MTLSWNILDFGVSYVRAMQGLGRAYQQEEDVRRVSSRIGEEALSIYWRAVALERLGPGLARLDREVEEALRLSRKASQDPLIDPMLPINFQRDTLNLQRELNQLHSSIAGATDQLKQLVGIPHGDRLRLPRSVDIMSLPHPSTDSAADIAVALRQRPEIRQNIYDLRITEAEVHATILQLLPGVTLSKTFASDSNSFLYHSSWISWGTRVAGNLMGLIRLPADIGAMDAQRRAYRQNALATAATIAMQVHVARARIQVHHRTYRDAQRFAFVQRQLLHQVRTSVLFGKIGQQALAREKLATLLADVRAILAFSDLHAAFAAYATARGDNPTVGEVIKHASPSHG